MTATRAPIVSQALPAGGTAIDDLDRRRLEMLDKSPRENHLGLAMSKTIEIADETAEIVARLGAMTGQEPGALVDEWARDRLAEVEARRATLLGELSRRLADRRPPVDGETVFAELRALHAARFGRT